MPAHAHTALTRHATFASLHVIHGAQLTITCSPSMLRDVRPHMRYDNCSNDWETAGQEWTTCKLAVGYNGKHRFVRSHRTGEQKCQQQRSRADARPDARPTADQKNVEQL